MSEVEVRAGDNVLNAMDTRATTGFYWSLTILATVGGFLFGYDTANIGSALQFIPYKLDAFWTGYMVAGASLGAAVGALLAGPLTDKFGRKSLLIVDAAIYAVGALLSGLAWHAAVLLIARTLIGLAIGADSAIATAYIAEYAPSNRRGSLSLIQQWMITVGILVSYLVALVILVLAPGMAKTLDWRLILGIGAIPAILGLVFRTKMPESPRWLLRHGKYEKVRDALSHLGIRATVEQIRNSAEELIQKDREQLAQRKSNWTPGVKRALVVVCVFFIFQQITGINVPLYYGPKLLGPLFGGGSDVDKAIFGVGITTLMTIVNVGATYIGFRYIDRLGRRAMSMGGFGGMAVSALIAAAGLVFLPTNSTSQMVMVMIGLCLFIACFALGVGGTGWLLQGEVFPTSVRGRAAAIAAVADWVANFALTEIFPAWENAWGLAAVLVSFTVLCVLAILFIFRFLPETKGLSVEDIVHTFERQAGNVKARA